MTAKLRFSSIVVIAVALLFSLAYFVKPKEAVMQIVSPAKMMPLQTISFPADASFAEQVMNSSSTAIVSHRNEYSNGNANSLEALRSWAAQEFHNDPRFLHPVILPKARSSSTFVNATAFSLLGWPYYAMSEAVTSALGERIENYCTSEAFNVFKADYIGVFGENGESATLLARYQADRARSAVNPVLALIYALAIILLAPLAVRPLTTAAQGWRAPFAPEERAAASAALFAYFALAVSFYYAMQAVLVESTSAPAIVAAIISGIAAAYVLFPLQVFVDSKEVLVLRSTISRRAVYIFGWMLFSVLSIQMLTWIKQGVLTEPDPVSLLISSFTGDFIHDPLAAKRLVASAIALSWLGSFGFILTIMKKQNSESSREIVRKLAGFGTKI
jgi:hypothetical protein